jgi:transposase
MKTLLAAPDLLALEKITLRPEAVVLVVNTCRPSACCPRCQAPSVKVHSRYVRSVADLPWQGNAVRLELHTRKFFCRNVDCPQKVFCERLPQVAEWYARQTCRLNEALALIGFALGGEAGARTAVKLGLRVSPDTLLNRIRQAAARQWTEIPVRVLGVDDFAFRRGHHYGTILVDLERRQPIDLLPDREAATLERWLKERPWIETVSRDRSPTYAEGIGNGAPQATQVADRWHVLKNLGEALERLLTRRSQSLQQAVAAVNQPRAGGAEILVGVEGVSMLSSRSSQQAVGNRAKRQARYEEVQALARQGGTILGIARQLKMSRVTVRKYLSSPVYPERAGTAARGSRFDRFLPYIHQRWSAGCHNARQLWREVVQQGYGGKEAMVRRYIKRLRKQVPNSILGQQSGTPELKGAFRRPSTRRVAWWLLEERETLTAEEQGFVEELCRADAEIEKARDLARRFHQMVREKRAEEFEKWVKQAESSGLAELKGFAEGLRKDQAAVVEALKSPWSNGQTEGQVNRLKMIKRQMFGRAKFDLLRARVLYAP